MGKAELSVQELVGMIERGKLRLPEMQRQYVWQATRVRDLMDSLYRKYPSGTILLWETDEDVSMRDLPIEQRANPYQATKLLLDGQQRLTSLSAVLRGKPVKGRWRKRPIELLFNLEHPDQVNFVTDIDENATDGESEQEEVIDATEDELEHRFNQLTFVVATKKLERLPNWVRVSDVFQSNDNIPFLKKSGVETIDDPRCEKYTQRLNRLRGIREYKYRIDVLERDLSYEEVTEIFVRVNSLGAKLRSSDLAMAQITAKWPNSLQIFEEFQQECADRGYYLDLGNHVKNLISFATGQCRFRTVRTLTVDQLQKSWQQANDGMRFACNFLKSNAEIESPALLSSPFLMIAIGYLSQQRGYALTAQEAAELRYWLLVANGKARFSRGATETLLDQDLARIREGKPIGDLIESLRVQFGRLDVEPGELESRNARSAYFKAMFLAFRADGAKDWVSNLAISLSHSGQQHRLQFHHIFPRALLRDRFPSRKINDIANLAFIGGKTNRRISNKEPKTYFPQIQAKQGDQAFASQCIPTAPDLLTVNAFPDFLAERRRLVARRLNEFLATARSTDL